MDKLRVAVITDIHAHSLPVLAKNAESWVTNQTHDSKADPFQALSLHVKAKSITADLLICAGDMADKADPGGHAYVWPKLHMLKDSLKASRLIATIGNHDIDSRLQKSEYDPKDSIQALRPHIPLEDRNSALEFWAENFSVLEQDLYRIVVLNTCAFHGYKKLAEAEFMHGRVSPRTLTSIEDYLTQSKARKLNILVCHHHPFKFDDIDVDDYSQMVGGDLLIQLLSRPKFGSWMIIHGHKHQSRLLFAPGVNDSPLVFAAGSFGVKFHSQMAKVQTNQFYILDFDLSAAPAIGAGVFGQLEAWSWIPNKNWAESRGADGLLPGSGFGCRERASEVAKKISEWHKSSGQPYSKWNEAKESLPVLRYCTHADLLQIEEALEEQYSVEVNSSNGQRRTISSIARRVP